MILFVSLLQSLIGAIVARLVNVYIGTGAKAVTRAQIHAFKPLADLVLGYRRQSREVRFVILDASLRNGCIYQMYVCVETGAQNVSVVLRSPTVDVLTVLTDGGREFVVFVRQFRPAVGDYVISNPAGGIDQGERWRDAAVREVREETGLELAPSATRIDFLARGLASPGTLNEDVTLCRITAAFTPHELDELLPVLKGRLSGNVHEGEETTVIVVRADMAIGVQGLCLKTQSSLKLGL